MKRKWTTKDGRKLWIKDMENDHLLNTLRLIRKHTRQIQLHQLWEAGKAFLKCDCEPATEDMEKEMAIYASDEHFNNLLPDIYHALLNETKKRGLNATQIF